MDLHTPYSAVSFRLTLSDLEWRGLSATAELLVIDKVISYYPLLPVNTRTCANDTRTRNGRRKLVAYRRLARKYRIILFVTENRYQQNSVPNCYYRFSDTIFDADYWQAYVYHGHYAIEMLLSDKFYELWTYYNENNDNNGYSNNDARDWRHVGRFPETLRRLDGSWSTVIQFTACHCQHYNANMQSQITLEYSNYPVSACFLFKQLRCLHWLLTGGKHQSQP